MHIHVFGLPWDDGVVDKSKGSGVFGLYSHRWLRMFHHDERVASGDGFAEIDVEGAKLGLGDGWHDGFDDLVNGEDIPIVGRVYGVVGEGK